MKKSLLVIFLFLLSFVPTMAQDDPSAPVRGGRVEAIKIAYLTKKLDLSPQEAQRFWPVYNRYSEDIRKARQDSRARQDNEIELEEKLLAIRKKYNDEFSKAISPEKVNLFFRAEKEFGSVLQHELNDRRQMRLENRRSKL